MVEVGVLEGGEGELDGERRQRGDALLAACAAFSMAMDALGVSFAAVTIDERLQKDDSMTLGYCGNVGQDSGELLFHTFLAMKRDPTHEVKYRRIVRELTTVTQ